MKTYKKENKCLTQTNARGLLVNINILLIYYKSEKANKFGSKWLLNELNRLGFWASPDAVSCYKQAVVENEDVSDIIKNYTWFIYSVVCR